MDVAAACLGQRRTMWRRSVVAGWLVLVGTSRGDAYFLDSSRNFELRARLYNETAVAAESSQVQTHPAVSPFQVIQQRTFFNPEFDARLTSYQSLLDDLSFRLALWGFYDGIYQYGTSQYARAANSIVARLSRGHTLSAPFSRTSTLQQPAKTDTYQPDPAPVDYGQPSHHPPA